jgi:hypothetical protein
MINDDESAMHKVTMRMYLELKNGSFVGTQDILQKPDSWGDLTPESRRLIKRYAALLMDAWGDWDGIGCVV